MHAKPSDKLVMMANQIADNLEIQGPDRAIAEMSSHIRRYWEPRMRETLLAYIREDGSALNPLAMKSLQAIWPDLKPGKTANQDGDGMIALPTDGNQSKRPAAMTPEASRSALQPEGAVPKIATVKTPTAPPASSVPKSAKKTGGKKPR